MSSAIEQDIQFIKADLVPELVFDRCFCEPGSREFVELASVAAEPLARCSRLARALYRATIVVRFSDVPATFRVLIKLLPECPEEDASYGAFLNEEIIWNKGALRYGRAFFPRFHVADMGRYGRPVIVTEDLRARGFDRVLGRKLNGDEAKLVIRLIGRFHAKGLALKHNDFPAFREFYAKFEETLPDGDHGLFQRTPGEKEAMLEKWANCTICQGLLVRENMWFQRDPETGQAVDARVLDWQRVRLGPGVIDLETILSQCQDDQRDSLRDFYVEIVREEVPEMSREDLLFDSGIGSRYARVVAQLASESESAE